MKKQYILVIFPIMLVLGCHEIIKSIFFKKEIVELKIELKNNSYEKVFLKTYLGEPIISISNNNKVSDITENIRENILFDIDAIFYKTYSDTLEIVYLNGVKRKDSSLQFKFHVKERTIDNVEFMNLFTNYKKFGYHKFPDE